MIRVRFDRRILFALRQIAVQRRDPDLMRKSPCQHGVRPAYLAFAWQKRQQIAFRFLFESEPDRPCEIRFQRCARIPAWNMDSPHRVHLSRTADYRRVAQQSGNAVGVKRCGHYQNPQIPAQLPEIKTECQCKIRMDAAFVEFIENDGMDA